MLTNIDVRKANGEKKDKKDHALKKEVFRYFRMEGYEGREAMKNVLLILITWILWVEANPKISEEGHIWKFISGHESKKECEKERKEMVPRFAKDYGVDIEQGITGFTAPAGTGPIKFNQAVDYDFFCIPDTIDPREPKAKK